MGEYNAGKASPLRAIVRAVRAALAGKLRGIARASSIATMRKPSNVQEMYLYAAKMILMMRGVMHYLPTVTSAHLPVL